MDDDGSKIAEKYEALRGVMDEKMRRLWAATEARALGYGGVSTVALAIGLTRPTITAGLKELGDARELVAIATKHRVRRECAGRPRLTDMDVGLQPALEAALSTRAPHPRQLDRVAATASQQPGSGDLFPGRLAKLR